MATGLRSHLGDYTLKVLHLNAESGRPHKQTRLWRVSVLVFSLSVAARKLEIGFKKKKKRRLQLS